jgi:hypothetical protein
MAIEVVPLTEADIPGAIEVIQQAFTDDPYFKWVFDEDKVCTVTVTRGERKCSFVFSLCVSTIYMYTCIGHTLESETKRLTPLSLCNASWFKPAVLHPREKTISSSTNKETTIPSLHVVAGESKMQFSTSPKKQSHYPPPQSKS